MQDKWLTVQEAANRLGVARATIYKWAKEGRLPIYKLGERVARVRSQDLERLLAEARPLYGAGKQDPAAKRVLVEKTKGAWADNPEIEQALSEIGNLGELRLTDVEKRAVLEAKEEIEKRFPLERLILFGSAARNEHGEESDIDLLAITKEKLTHRDRNIIYNTVFETNFKYGTNLSVVVADAFSWNQGVLSLTPLHAEVRQDGIPV
ncbi:MAG: helix-turn-helix domain-containing protein [Bacillota bacterium]